MYPYQCADGGVKSARVVVRDADTVSGREAGRAGNGDLFLAVVAIQRERAFNGIRLKEHGFFPAPADRDMVFQVQRVPHRIGSGTDFHGSAAQTRDIIHGGLESPVVVSGYIGFGLTDGDGGSATLVLHRFASADRGWVDSIPEIDRAYLR